MSRLSHIDDAGRAAMVDVSDKAESERSASAEAIVMLSEEAFRLAVSGTAPKGDVMATARIAGIMAAKRTSELVPLCHPLTLTHAGVEFTPLPERHALRIVGSARTKGVTGVEMEALTAASVAALTVYDMVKAVDRAAHIESIRLLTKSGGKSGTFAAAEKQVLSGTAPRKKARPRVLTHEGGLAVASTGPQSEREALRQFMLARRLRASEWAKSAAVPVNELYAFLNGRSRTLSPVASKRLAAAAHASVEEMLGLPARSRSGSAAAKAERKAPR